MTLLLTQSCKAISVPLNNDNVTARSIISCPQYATQRQGWKKVIVTEVDAEALQS